MRSTGWCWALACMFWLTLTTVRPKLFKIQFWYRFILDRIPILSYHDWFFWRRASPRFLWFLRSWKPERFRMKKMLSLWQCSMSFIVTDTVVNVLANSIAISNSQRMPGRDTGTSMLPSGGHQVDRPRSYAAEMQTEMQKSKIHFQFLQLYLLLFTMHRTNDQPMPRDNDKI